MYSRPQAAPAAASAAGALSGQCHVPPSRRPSAHPQAQCRNGLPWFARDRHSGFPGSPAPSWNGTAWLKNWPVGLRTHRLTVVPSPASVTIAARHWLVNACVPSGRTGVPNET